MKQLLLLIAVLLMCISCKKDAPEPDPEVAWLVGNWQEIAREQTVDGELQWEAVQQGAFLTFRFDGVLLNEKGLPACCGPTAFNINGVDYPIVPKAKIEENPACSLVDCFPCATWDLEQNGNELILSPCLGPRTKYVKR